MLVGMATASAFFLLSVIFGASRYAWNTCGGRARRKREGMMEVLERMNGYRCAQVDRLLAYRSVQMERLVAFTSTTIGHFSTFKVTKISRLRTYKQATVTSTLQHMDRMKEYYLGQTAKVKDSCVQQVDRLRESYESGRGRLKDYRSQQMERMRINFNGQVARVEEYGAGQMDFLRQQYTNQQQCLLKLLELINVGSCVSEIEEDCRKTESVIFDSELDFRVEDGQDDDENSDVFREDGDDDDEEVERELARSISEIERICKEGIQRSYDHFRELFVDPSGCHGDLGKQCGCHGHPEKDGYQHWPYCESRWGDKRWDDERGCQSTSTSPILPNTPTSNDILSGLLIGGEDGLRIPGEGRLKGSSKRRPLSLTFLKSPAALRKKKMMRNKSPQFNIIASYKDPMNHSSTSSPLPPSATSMETNDHSESPLPSVAPSVPCSTRDSEFSI